jgi:hypothetical protein
MNDDEDYESPEEALKAAREEIAHLKKALAGTQQWAGRLLYHCKKNNLPVTAVDLLGDEGWIDDRMTKISVAPERGLSVT